MDPIDEAQHRRKSGNIIMKYVRNESHDFVFGLINIDHRKLVTRNPVSAGFIDLTKMETFGYSISLNLKPKDDDVELIKLLLGHRE